MDIEKLNGILRKFVANTRGLEDAVLVSEEAELISDPIQGWDEGSVMGMAVAMFSLTDSTSEHLGWPVLQQMWLQTEESYLIGVCCTSEVYLLVKAINTGRLGELRIAIERTVEQVQGVMTSQTFGVPTEQSPPAKEQAPPSTDNKLKYRNRRPLF